MDHELEQSIQRRAQEIWNRIGRPEGKPDQYWLAAEREVLAAGMQPPIRVTSEQKATTLRMTPRQRKRARARRAYIRDSLAAGRTF
jgi:Protein of unknown function (DUF2934)